MIKKLLIIIIKIYQITLSPFFGNCCRFTPTCSAYAIEALKKHGAIKGLFLTIKRLLKCNRFHKGGDDPVP